jgi:hypothetical protein
VTSVENPRKEEPTMVNLNELDTYDTETLTELLKEWKEFTQKVVNDVNDLRDENLILRARIAELQNRLK